MKKKMVCHLLMVCMGVSLCGCSTKNTEKTIEENVTAETIAEESTDSEDTDSEDTNSKEAEQESAPAQEAENTEEDLQEEDINMQEEKEIEMAEQEQTMYEVPEGFDAEKEGVVYGEMVEITYESATTQTTRKANVILPPDYSEDKEYPILYLLHGIGGDHNEWKGGMPVNVVSNLIADKEAPEMIVVMPNVRAREKDGGNPQDIYSLEHYKAFDNFINDLRDDLMPYMEANYPVAKGRENTAIAGLSMGGRESLYIGFSMPETFGYIGAFCPAPGLLAYSNFGVSEEGLFTKEAFTLPAESDTFVMIVAGAGDTIVSTWPEVYHKTLEENGVENTFYVTAGGHDFGVWKHGLYNFVKCIFD